MGAGTARRTSSTLLLSLVALLAIGTCGARARKPLRPEVLIVVNGASPLSVAIGDYYRQRRNVPAANVVTLNVPLADPNLGNSVQETVVSQATFDAQIRTPIQNFLVSNGLVDQIQYIVIASGVPLRFSPSASTPSTCLLSYAQYLRDCARASVDAELAVLFSTLPGAGGIGATGQARNPYYDSDLPFASWRAANPSTPLRYLVARLTGYQTPLDAGTGIPTDVKALIDRAQTALPAGSVLVDQNPTQAPGLRAANALWLNPVASLLGALGVSVQNDTASTFVSNASGLVGYASWGSNDNANPGAPYYGTVGGNVYPGAFTPRSIAADLVSTSARSFVSPPIYGQSLSADLVRLGAAGVAGSTWEPYAFGLARAPVLFRHYFGGARAIEAYWRAVPYLSWMNVWVGDPLMVTSWFLLPSADADGDGVADASDNCRDLANANQRDTDGDGYGNLCDADLNGDGVVTTSWGVVTPPSARGDLERIQLTVQGGGYDQHQDLDGDGDVDDDDAGIASYRLFFPPGPSGLHP
ncbi:MAG: hypothetical protein DCC71_15825 [Proteobacteria bacterium]|nr:MAG: hypothetical protein DCC71_15825 [Pseudomonadota bacterium]